ncbi:hypothetical protein Q8W71_14175 [Methylobacterium sp. NEAU 140]|uniref:GCG_CRPN prefix-to-repeats domain-containing protein n=1 Tax=Methylobacterium sp. NEAU 140 TaxID=3064945 RepID=UPI002737538C|nr:hypothetical protein [Methylobacterium sp. NEAU 140]MDP4023777.1 hypothetical protein [Methylobacterium sp. NEAU 140]
MTIVSAPGAKALVKPLIKPLVLAAAMTGGLGLAGTAQAAGGCGPGFHPNPWGICRPNWGPRPYWGPRPHWGPRPDWRRPAYYGGYGPPRPFYGPRPFY